MADLTPEEEQELQELEELETLEAEESQSSMPDLKSFNESILNAQKDVTDIEPRAHDDTRTAFEVPRGNTIPYVPPWTSTHTIGLDEISQALGGSDLGYSVTPSATVRQVVETVPRIALGAAGATTENPWAAMGLAGAGQATGGYIGDRIDDLANIFSGSQLNERAPSYKRALGDAATGATAEGITRLLPAPFNREGARDADSLRMSEASIPAPPNVSRQMGGARYEKALADPEKRAAMVEKLDPEGLNLARLANPGKTEAELKNTAPREVYNELNGEYIQQLPKGKLPTMTGLDDYARSLVSASGKEGSLIKEINESVENIAKKQLETNDLIPYGDFRFPDARKGAPLTEDTALTVWNNFRRDPETGEIIGDGVINTIARAVDNAIQKRIADETVKKQVIFKTVEQLRALPQKDVTIAEVNQLKRNFGIDAKLDGPFGDIFSTYANIARYSMKELEEQTAARYGADGARIIENNGKVSRYLPVVESLEVATKKAGQGPLPERRLHSALFETLGLVVPKQTQQQSFEATAAAAALRDPENIQLGFQPELQSISRNPLANIWAKGNQAMSDYATGPMSRGMAMTGQVGGRLFANSSKAWRNFIVDDVPEFLIRGGIITQADSEALTNARTELEYMSVLEQMAQNNPALMELMKQSKLLLPSEKSAYEQQYKEHLDKRSIPTQKAFHGLEAIGNNERPD